MPDIALFLPLLVIGGAERSFLNLAQGFLNKGYSVDLVLAQARGLLLEQVPSKVKIVDLQSSRILTSPRALAR